MIAIKISFWFTVLIYFTFTQYSDCFFKSKEKSFLKRYPGFEWAEKKVRSRQAELPRPKGFIQDGHVKYLYHWMGNNAYVLLDADRHILARDLEHQGQATTGSLYDFSDNVYVNGRLMCSSMNLNAQHNPNKYNTIVWKRGKMITIEKMKPCREEALMRTFEQRMDRQEYDRANRSSIFKNRPLLNGTMPSTSRGPSREYSAEKFMKDHPGFKEADAYIYRHSNSNEASGTYFGYIYRWVSNAWYVIIDQRGRVLVRDASTKTRAKLFNFSWKGIESKVGTLSSVEDNVFVNGQLFCVNLKLKAPYDPTAHTTSIFKDANGIIFQYFKPQPREALKVKLQQNMVRVDERDLRRKGPVGSTPDHHMLEPKPEEKRYGPDGKLIKKARFRENPVDPGHAVPAPFQGALKKTPRNANGAEGNKENRLPEFNRGNSPLSKDAKATRAEKGKKIRFDPDIVEIDHAGRVNRRNKESLLSRNSGEHQQGTSSRTRNAAPLPGYQQTSNSHTWMEIPQPSHRVTSHSGTSHSATRAAGPRESHKKAINSHTWTETPQIIHQVTSYNGTRNAGSQRSRQQASSRDMKTDTHSGLNSKFGNLKINADHGSSSVSGNQGEQNLCTTDFHVRDRKLKVVESEYRLWVPITGFKEDFECVSQGYQHSPLRRDDATLAGYILYSPKGMILVSAWHRNNEHYCLVDIGVKVNVYKSNGDRVFPSMESPRSTSKRYAIVDTNKDLSDISVVTKDEEHFHHPLLVQASHRLSKGESVRDLKRLEGFYEERGIGYALVTYDGYMMVFSEMTSHKVYWTLPEEKANVYFNDKMFYPKKSAHDESRATTEVNIRDNGIIKVNSYDRQMQRWKGKARHPKRLVPNN